MSMQAVIPVPVPFHGDVLWAVPDADHTALVAIKPIVVRLGLDWAGQYQRIIRHEVLGPAVITVRAPAVWAHGGVLNWYDTNSTPDERDKTFVCLPLDMIPGFLFGIDAKRVKPEAREAVLRYQRECFAVLARHFLGTPMEGDEGPQVEDDDIPLRAAGPPTGGVPHAMLPVTDRLCSIQEVRTAMRLYGRAHAQRLWKDLGLPVYEDLLPEGSPLKTRSIYPEGFDLWWSDFVRPDPGAVELAASFWQSWQGWCVRTGREAGSQRVFGEALGAAGLALAGKDGAGRVRRRGARLLATH